MCCVTLKISARIDFSVKVMCLFGKGTGIDFKWYFERLWFWVWGCVVGNVSNESFYSFV